MIVMTSGTTDIFKGNMLDIAFSVVLSPRRQRFSTQCKNPNLSNQRSGLTKTTSFSNC